MNQLPRLLKYGIACLCMASATALASNANWMANIPNNRILNQLIIPGTHDSGTYAINPQSKFSLSTDDPLPSWLEIISNLLPQSMIRPVIAGWSKTQPESLTEQLNNGIRYFDLRVCFDKSSNNFYLCHALLGVQLIVALRQIQQFARNHPSEIIILDFNHLYNITTSNTFTSLIEKIDKSLNQLAVPNTLHPNNTIGDIKKTQRNIIIILDNKDNLDNNILSAFSSQYLWHQSQINSPWPNVTTASALKQKLDADITFRAANYQVSKQFFVLQAIKTEDTTQIIDGILDPKNHPNNIMQYEKDINDSLYNWLNRYVSTYGYLPINIVITDWFNNQKNMIEFAKNYDYLPSQENAGHTVNANKIAALKSWAKNLGH